MEEKLLNEVKEDENKEVDFAEENNEAQEDEYVGVEDGTHTSEEQAASAEDTEPVEPAAVQQAAEKMIPQSEVNNIVGRTRMEAREKARAEYLSELLEKYGIKDEVEMDGIFGKGQQYDVLNDDYTNQTNEFQALREENALLKSEVIPEKWEDAKLIIRGKGLQVSPETIAAEMATHPEWKKLAVEEANGNGQGQVTPQLEVLGNERTEKVQAPNDDEIINKFFRV